MALENRDLLLTLVGHDLDTSGFELHIAEGLDATAQRIKVRLKLFLGEWFLDLLAGIPYYQDILVKNPDETAINAIIKEAILSVPTVIELVTYTASLDNARRTFTVTFHCRTEDGTIESDFVLP